MTSGFVITLPREVDGVKLMHHGLLFSPTTDEEVIGLLHRRLAAEVVVNDAAIMEICKRFLTHMSPGTLSAADLGKGIRFLLEDMLVVFPSIITKPLTNTLTDAEFEAEVNKAVIYMLDFIVRNPGICRKPMYDQFFSRLARLLSYEEKYVDGDYFNFWVNYTN